VKTPSTCYACDQPATTKEHVPPRSFFPEGHRDNLMTVPSCEQHNNAISMDVEYTRNVLSTYFGTNTVGQQHFNDKALRSFDRSPALLYQTFGKMRPVKVQGMTIGAYPMEIERVENLMQSCVCALHFFRTGERKPNWNIVLASASHPSDAPDAIVQEWLQVLSLFRQTPR
jgi:hypothetical protein